MSSEKSFFAQCLKRKTNNLHVYKKDFFILFLGLVTIFQFLTNNFTVICYPYACSIYLDIFIRNIERFDVLMNYVGNFN